METSSLNPRLAPTIISVTPSAPRINITDLQLRSYETKPNACMRCLPGGLKGVGVLEKLRGVKPSSLPDWVGIVRSPSHVGIPLLHVNLESL